MFSSLKIRLENLSSRQEALSEEIDPKRESALLDFMVRVVPRMLDAERCSVFILDPENRKAWLKAGTAVSERGIEVSLKDSVVGRVISSGEAVIINDLHGRSGAHKNIDAGTGFVTREIICVPIRSKGLGEVAGAIQVLNKKGGGGFTAEDQGFLEEAGGHLQSIVDSVFLAQEAIGIGKKLISVATSVAIIGFFLGTVGGSLVMFFSLIGHF